MPEFSGAAFNVVKYSRTAVDWTEFTTQRVSYSHNHFCAVPVKAPHSYGLAVFLGHVYLVVGSPALSCEMTKFIILLRLVVTTHFRTGTA